MTATQEFDVTQVIPSVYGIAAAAVVPSLLATVQEASPLARMYDTLGELASAAAVGVVYAALL